MIVDVARRWRICWLSVGLGTTSGIVCVCVWPVCGLYEIERTKHVYQRIDIHPLAYISRLPFNFLERNVARPISSGCFCSCEWLISWPHTNRHEIYLVRSEIQRMLRFRVSVNEQSTPVNVPEELHY